MNNIVKKEKKNKKRKKEKENDMIMTNTLHFHKLVE